MNIKMKILISTALLVGAACLGSLNYSQESTDRNTTVFPQKTDRNTTMIDPNSTIKN
ncbi:RapH phosphatase inhibitor [Bacillus safensis]|nr:RapH phosphatase inhibitor [Bacillus safensis]